MARAAGSCHFLSVGQGGLWSAVLYDAAPAACPAIPGHASRLVDIEHRDHEQDHEADPGMEEVASTEQVPRG